jgi:hypothetical protein
MPQGTSSQRPMPQQAQQNAKNYTKTYSIDREQRPDPPASSLQPAPIPPKEAPGLERHTISEDRSAGSNLEVRNLAALKDRTASQKSSEPIVNAARIIKQTYVIPAPNAGALSTGHTQTQQRFGQLRLDEKYPDEHIDEGDQRTLQGDLFTADLSAGHDCLRPQLVAKHDWMEHIEHMNADSGLQANIEMLQRNLTSMQKDLSELEMQKQSYANRQFQILYRIAGTCYFDHPEWTQGSKSIVSRVPVKNLDLFLERNKNVVFIVYRDFDHAPPRIGAKSRMSSPQHVRESIHPVSRQLRKTLQMMLKHDWRYETMFLHLHRKREIDAPYLFVYHHRTHWKDMLAQCPPTIREHLNLLAMYISENYGKEYMAADALFARRKVSAEFMKYLVQPGDILISRSEGQYRGLVASSWFQEHATVLARGFRGTKIPGQGPHGYDHLNRYTQQLESEFDSKVDSDSALDSESDVDTSEEQMRSSAEADEHEKEDFLRQFLRRMRPETGSKEADDKKTVSPETPDKKFEIKTWQWNFDGDFKRVEGNVMLRLSQSTVNDSTRPKEWNMHDLDVYPLRFAPQSLVQTLHRRGMMFWQCRKRSLVSYHESNAEVQDQVGRFLFSGTFFERVNANLCQV